MLGYGGRTYPHECAFALLDLIKNSPCRKAPAASCGWRLFHSSRYKMRRYPLLDDQSLMCTLASDRLVGFSPFIDRKSKILLLGSMPSVASLQAGFYYMHPRNRLWPLVSICVQRQLPAIADRKQAANDLHLAIWDVIQACRREGSLDSNVRDIEPADIKGLLKNYPQICGIITNGKLAARLLAKYFPSLSVPVYNLPSTSPANAAWSLERLAKLYCPLLRRYQS